MKHIDYTSSLTFKPLFFLYILCLSLLGLIDNFSRYNFIVEITFSFVLFITMRDRVKVVFDVKFFLIVFFLIFINLLYAQWIPYVIIDVFLVFYVLASIHVAALIRIDKAFANLVINIFLFIILLEVLFLLSPKLYSSLFMRYEGLFGGSNVNISILYVISAVVCELSYIYHTRNKYRSIFVFVVIVTSLILFMSQTRSALFFMPYLFYCACKLFKKKYVYLFSLFIIFFLYVSNYNQILVEVLRLEEDSSYNTRASFYEIFINGIRDNYFVVPHGSHSAIELIRFETVNDDMSPHNDFLRYIYDWGAIFYMFVIFVVAKVNRLFVLHKKLILLTIGIISCSLHNILFSPYIWIPFIIFLSIYSKKNYVGCCKKV